MKSILFLCHRIPFPPDKGDKIRSYHILRALAGRYRIHLATFADTADDLDHVQAIRNLAERVECRYLSPRMAALRAAAGLLTGVPLSLPYYRDRVLRRWIDDTIASHQIDLVFIFSSAMGQYVDSRRVPATIIDFCDVDSDKWRQYAESKPWPLSAVYRREAGKLQAYDCGLAQAADLSLFVSDAECRLFSSCCKGAAARLLTVRNGVDTGYFDPVQVATPDRTTSRAVVFTGAMDYWANVDAVKWFVESIWPAVRRQHGDARFLVVGARPVDAIRRLAAVAGVEVVGRVPDVRPYLAAAAAVVAPLRIARGVQNKVLEALAMARPIVATPAALAGFDRAEVPGVCREATEQGFAEAVAGLLSRQPCADNAAGRRYVVENFGWDAAVAPLLARVAEVAGRRSLQ